MPDGKQLCGEGACKQTHTELASLTQLLPPHTTSYNARAGKCVRTRAYTFARMHTSQPAREGSTELAIFLGPTLWTTSGSRSTTYASMLCPSGWPVYSSPAGPCPAKTALRPRYWVSGWPWGSKIAIFGLPATLGDMQQHSKPQHPKTLKSKYTKSATAYHNNLPENLFKSK